MICDLPSLAHQLLYFIPAPPDGPWNEGQGAQVQDDFQVYDGLGEIVLQCQWNIAHMYHSRSKSDDPTLNHRVFPDAWIYVIQ
jgi:hypothetical protein